MSSAFSTTVPSGAPDAAAAAEVDAVCLFCDVETQDAVAQMLLKALAARRAEGGKRTVEECVARLRDKLLPAKPTKKGGAIDLGALNAALEEACVAKGSGLGGLFTSKDELAKKAEKERKELDVSFRHPQREKLAAELIACYDSAKEWHCGAVLCQTSPRSVTAAESHRLKCIYRPLACRNEGCVSVHSAWREAAHDQQCEHKVMPCTLECGKQVPRRLMAEHLSGLECPNKPVECSFVQIGCTAKCTQGTLAAHLESHTAQHLEMTLRVVTAQQVSINELQAAYAAQLANSNSAVAQAAEIAALRGRVETLEAQREAMAERVRSSEQELRQALGKAKTEVSAQSSKDAKRVEEAMGKQIKASAAAAEKAAKDEVAKLRAAVEGVSGRLEEMAAGKTR